MAEVVVSLGADADIGRLVDFLMEQEPSAALAAYDLVLEGLVVLQSYPLIGRPVNDGLRELVISHGKSGYVALYEFDVRRNRVLILALRHQREAGYVDRDQME